MGRAVAFLAAATLAVAAKGTAGDEEVLRYQVARHAFDHPGLFPAPRRGPPRPGALPPRPGFLVARLGSVLVAGQARLSHVGVQGHIEGLFRITG